MKKKKFTGAALAALVLYACAPSSASLQLEGVSVLTEEASEAGQTGGETAEEPAAAEAETSSCFVHVCGAVTSPGVYELPAGSRVFEALELAGGITEEGAAAALNLAEMIHDGEQIFVPTWEQLEAGWTAPADGQAQDGKININTATMEQLMMLSGIGESRARDIISYREEHGPFSQIQDIMQVSGIKEAAFERINDYITVD